MDVLELFRIADTEDIPVFYYPLPYTSSCSINSGLGKSAIGIDCSKITTQAEERERLAHELGHCVTGSFYNQHSTADLRSKHERNADKWAITKLMPFDDLICAFKKGFREVWELAEHFDVPDDFVQKALKLYERNIPHEDD